MTMYELPSLVLASGLLAGLFLALELGYRAGRRRQAQAPEAVRSHINGLQGSLLGILGLLLGFAFSLALQRFDRHTEVVVEEANAIGTVWQRSDLLTPPHRAELQEMLRRYVGLRVQAGGVDLAHRADLERLTGEARTVQAEIWVSLVRAAAEEANRWAAQLLIPAVNGMGDAFDRRQAELRRHVPGAVLGLLGLALAFTAAIIGFTAGVAGHRPSWASYGMMVLIALVVVLILDLDRPRRGLVQVSQQPLIDLQQGMQRR